MDNLSLARFAAAAYTSPPTWIAGDIHAVLTATPEGPLVAVRGTVLTNVEDLERDVDAVAEWHPRTGYCARGFISGALALQAVIGDAFPRNAIIAAHSLGGAVGIGLTAQLVIAGNPPALLVTFASPRVGRAWLHELMLPVPQRHYYRCPDGVPIWPPWFDAPQPHIELPGVGIEALLRDPVANHLIEGFEAYFEANPA